jgi:hypothetical protein
MSEYPVEPEFREIRLPNGLLKVHVHHAYWPLNRLCGFAARNNPRRGFLFVSKVLGKHWPSDPLEMLAAHEALASRISPPDAVPAVFIGMAETATGLGQGVFEAYLRRYGPGSAIYIQTTRYPISGATILPFEEKHSHAQRLRLHWPERTDLQAIFLNAPMAVLIDDELSTGQTFLALSAAYQAVNPSLRRLSLVSLTDFMGDDARACFKVRAGVEKVNFISLLAGSFEFKSNPAFCAADPATAQAEVSCRRAQMGPFSARLGTDQPVHLPDTLMTNLLKQLPVGRPVLVLGTGEFMHPAFCVAQKLAHTGRTVTVQSTTRSPILMAADIQSCIKVPDPYGEAIPNYLYNVNPAGQSIILCTETQPSERLADIERTLEAKLVMLNGAVHHGP